MRVLNILKMISPNKSINPEQSQSEFQLYFYDWLAELLSKKLYWSSSRLQNKEYDRDKKGHFIKIKGLIQQKDIMIPNIYAPNHKVLKYMKFNWQNWKKRMRDPKVLRNFNTPLLGNARPTRQRISKYTEDLATPINLT